MSRNFLKYFNTIFFALIIGFFPLQLKAATSDFSSFNDGAKVRLLSAYNYDQNNNKKLLLGFHFKLKDGWKIYGKSDSSFTQPPAFNFENSSNIDVKNFNILWPEPKIVEEKILNDTLTYPIYEKEVVIPIEVTILDQNKDVDLKVDLNYGLCNEICIPAEQKIDLKIASNDDDQESLNFIKNFHSSNQNQAQNSNLSLSLFKAIIIAFIGGLILNIMPCVLPVLSIKLLSIINHSKSSVRKIRIAYFSTIIGVLFCFLIFATITAIFKSLGNQIGWGVQFQNPYFLIFLTLILTIFSANLIGLFEINANSSLSSFLNRKITNNENKDGLFHVVIANFLSGILAVLLATPCSAPFVGTAISFAFTQDILTIFTIFSFMALGLAFPYVVLIIFPKAINILPKPGKWMILVKNIMAGFLLATIIWLIYILSDNIGFNSAMALAFICIFTLAWFRITSKLKIGKIIQLLVLALISFLSFYIPISIQKETQIAKQELDEIWIKFDEAQIANYVNQGKVVIVDVGADWCITCKVNKKLVLDSKEVVEILKKPDVVAMFGDLTKPNQEISEFMAKHNRFAIPFNIVFGPKAKNGILVSELLDKKELIKVINLVR